MQEMAVKIALNRDCVYIQYRLWTAESSERCNTQGKF
jgi:hypothetical protein